MLINVLSSIGRETWRKFLHCYNLRLLFQQTTEKIFCDFKSVHKLLQFLSSFSKNLSYYQKELASNIIWITLYNFIMFT